MIGKTIAGPDVAVELEDYSDSNEPQFDMDSDVDAIYSSEPSVVSGRADEQVWSDPALERQNDYSHAEESQSLVPTAVPSHMDDSYDDDSYDLSPEDEKIMNRNSLLEVSKKILNENKNFKVPEELVFKLPGESVRGEMNKIIEKLYNEKVILDHGVQVAKELANVLSGGDTTIDKTLTEDDLFKLELDAFMRLIETKKTQERIKHTLATGKPLVN